MFPLLEASIFLLCGRESGDTLPISLFGFLRIGAHLIYFSLWLLASAALNLLSEIPISLTLSSITVHEAYSIRQKKEAKKKKGKYIV